MQTFSITAYNLALYNCDSYFPGFSPFPVVPVVHFFDWIQNNVAAHIIYLKTFVWLLSKMTENEKKMNVL